MVNDLKWRRLAINEAGAAVTEAYREGDYEKALEITERLDALVSPTIARPEKQPARPKNANTKGATKWQ